MSRLPTNAEATSFDIFVWRFLPVIAGGVAVKNILVQSAATIGSILAFALTM
jgi:hypothetical protein